MKPTKKASSPKHPTTEEDGTPRDRRGDSLTFRLRSEQLDARPPIPKNQKWLTPVVNILRAHNPRGHQPGNQARFTKQWCALKKRLGIRADLHIHDLRRTVAEDVWSATNDLRAVQHQLGHQRITTTAKYLERTINLEELSATLAESLPSARSARSRPSARPQPNSPPSLRPEPQSLLRSVPGLRYHHRTKLK